MNCRWSDQIEAYYDGELPASTAAELREHLQFCESCVGQLEALREISARLTNAAMSEACPESLRRWMSALAESRDRSLRRLVGWMTAAAAAVILIASSIVVFRDSRAPDRELVQIASTPMLAPGESAGMALVFVDDTSVEGEAEDPDDTFVAARWMAMDLSSGGGERQAERGYP